MSMQKLFPHPALSVALFLTWLLLNNTLAAGHIVLGAILGVLVPLFSRRFWPEAPQTRSWPLLARYIAMVIRDIVVANVAVARLVFVPNAELRPAFIEMPLRLRDPFAITLLTSTVSLTPGTVSADLSKDRKWLLIHCLSLEDEQDLLRTIQTRYESPLTEIFGC